MATTPPPNAPAVPTDPKELRKILERAQNGDKKTLPVLREMLQGSLMAEAYGNLAALAESALIDRCAGKNLAVSESMHLKLGSLRAELAGTNPTPLERQRIATCWLHLHHLEVVYADKESMSLELGSYYQRSITTAQKRYLAAIKMLAVVRKLALPVVQVNIAKKQVNVAGPSVAIDSSKAVPSTAAPG